MTTTTASAATSTARVRREVFGRKSRGWLASCGGSLLKTKRAYALLPGGVVGTTALP